jgi:hypothetical protein
MPSPTVLISAPRQIGSCEGLILNASGSMGGAGRPFKAAWSVQLDAGVEDAAFFNLRSLIPSSGSPVLELPGSPLLAGNYYISTIVFHRFSRCDFFFLFAIY